MLVGGTPQAFRVALSECEIWAVLAAESPGPEALDTRSHGDNTTNNTTINNTTNNTTNNATNNTTAISSNSTTNSAATAPTSIAALAAAQLNSLRNNFRLFQTSQPQSPTGGDTSLWPHDRKTDKNTLCLWSDAAEVT